jgi:hypothetical protein
MDLCIESNCYMNPPIQELSFYNFAEGICTCALMHFT